MNEREEERGQEDRQCRRNIILVCEIIKKTAKTLQGETHLERQLLYHNKHCVLYITSGANQHWGV